jgi:hypothetical protein
MRRTLVVMSIVALASGASAAPLVVDRAVVVGRVDGGAWSDVPTEARSDQEAQLAAVVVARRGKQRVVLVPDGVDRLVLGGRKVGARGRAPLDAKSIRWITVEPHGFRKSKSANGATSTFYSNVSTESLTFGTWLGYDTVDYFEHVLFERGDAIIAAAIVPSDTGAVQVPGLGTLRYKVEVELADGQRAASPGIEATDAYGVLPSVHRVSIRAGDDFLGQLSGYLLVPEVFGSAGPGKNHQTDRFVGADCADVMVGAERRRGKQLPYTNVAGLPSYAKQIVGNRELDAQGKPDTEISGVQRGDLIRIDYGGALRGHTPRGWDHVAALWEDKSDPNGPAKGGPDGKLDGFDLVIHVGHPRLVIEPLARQSPATIDVLRWKK